MSLGVNICRIAGQVTGGAGLTFSAVRLRSSELEWREVDGEVLVYDARAERFFALTSTGALLWILLSEGHDTESSAAMLVERTGMDDARARVEVARFVFWSEDQDLLVPGREN